MTSSNRKTKTLRLFWNAFPWILVLGILAFIALMWINVGRERERLNQARIAAMEKEIPATRVITLTLEPVRLEDKINLPAQVEPHEDLWMKSEVFGQVTDILVEEGQRVRQGDVLVTLDDRDYRSRLERIEANYNLMRQEYNRYVSLAKKKIAAKNKLEEIEARLKDAAAQRKEAQLALDRTRIASPIGGHLNHISPVKGDLLKVGDPVAQILDVDNVKVTVGVPESDVSAIFDLDEATVILEALEGLRITGKKLFLSYQPRTLARLYDLELLVPNPDGRIRPGMFARVELVKKVFENALVIPLYAVITQNEDQFVYVENDRHAKKRHVEIGILTGWQVQVVSGLSVGDRVVVVGQRQLDEGHALDVIKNVARAEEILQP